MFEDILIYCIIDRPVSIGSELKIYFVIFTFIFTRTALHIHSDTSSDSGNKYIPLIYESRTLIIAAKFGTHTSHGIIRNLNLQLSSGGLTDILRPI